MPLIPLVGFWVQKEKGRIKGKEWEEERIGTGEKGRKYSE